MLARQIATLDQLSGGRLTVGIGLGDDGWREFSAFGDETSARERGAMLDESLQVITSFLTGNVVDFAGRHYTIDAAQLVPRPVQDPVPFWAAVRWPNHKPLARSARLQGCFPIFKDSGQLPAPPAAADLAALRAALTDLNAPRSHDLVVRVALHRLAPDARADAAAAMADAGVTWLLEAFAPGHEAAQIEAHVRSGPPSGTLGR